MPRPLIFEHKELTRTARDPPFPNLTIKGLFHDPLDLLPKILTPTLA